MTPLGKSKAGFLALVLAVNLLLLGGPYANEARACSCAGTTTTEEALRESDAVFSGKAIKVEEIAPESIGGNTTTYVDLATYMGPVAFDVTHSWKGVSGETVVVRGQGDEASCGMDFDKGEDYLVFAYRLGESRDGPLATNFCGATRRAGGETALGLLGEPTDVLPDTGGTPDRADGWAGRTLLVGSAFTLAMLAIGASVARRNRSSDQS